MESGTLSSADGFGFCLTAPTNLKYQKPLQKGISGCLNAFDPLCKSAWRDTFLTVLYFLP